MLVKAIVVVVLVVILGPILRTVWNMGYGLHYHKHHPGKCRVLKRSGVGSEDFQILSSGLTFITSGLVMGLAPDEAKAFVKSKGKGSIQIVDMNLPSPEVKVVPFKHDKNFDPDTFRPHGLSVLEDKVKGEHLVYVINHAENQVDRVEKFRYSPKTQELHHVKSIFSDVFRVTNDLTLTSEDNFYITNWMYFNSHNLNTLEQVYQLPLVDFMFYNGTGITTIEDRMFNPNSIILSKDQRYLYVALPNLRLVKVYKRKSDYDLQLVQEVNVHTGLDNFHLSENGDSLYGGCHPIPHKAAAHFFHPDVNKAPSHVIRLPLKNGLIVEKEITQEFYDQGDLISGSSVAGVYKNKMLIGSVIDTLVMCQLPEK